MVRLHEKVPRGLLDAFDDSWKGMYSHRADALREAIRDFIEKRDQQKRLRQEAKAEVEK
jgi:metal-responsive CopG/Arc/MetJ family transcriptional regulator